MSIVAKNKHAGRNLHNGIHRGFTDRGRPIRIAIAAGIALAVAVFVAIRVWRQDDAPAAASQEPAPIVEVAAPPVTQVPPKAIPPAEKSEEMAAGGGGKAAVPKAAAEPSALSDSRPLTKEEQWAVMDANRLAKSEEILLKRGPKTHFDNEFENTLELVSIPGATFFAPPVIDLDEAEVLEYLRKPVVILPGDSDADIEAKERMAEFKQRALEFVESGGTISQFVRDTLAENQERKNMMEEINLEKQRILLNEGEEAAQAYVEEMNEHLRAQGLPEIKIGRGDRIALRRRQQEEAEAAANAR